MADNVVTCPVCHKTLISEELVRHPCLNKFRAVQTIKIDHFSVLRNAEGKDDVLAFGRDGKVYSLESSDETLQEDYSEWLRRRLYRTSSPVL